MKIKNIAKYIYDYSRIKIGLKTPVYIILFVSDRCNLKCRHCFWWKGKDEFNEISLVQFEKIATSLKHPLKTLHITGGEPFLRDDIVDIIKIFVDKNHTKDVTISTNGILVDKIVKECKIINKIVPELSVSVSLDGLEKFHDKMRCKKGAFKAAT